MQKVHLYVFSHMVFFRKQHKVWIYKMKIPFEVPEKKQICVPGNDGAERPGWDGLLGKNSFWGVMDI